MSNMRESVFAVPKMDCPSEERMIRSALAGLAGVRGIECDLSGRKVRVVHDGEPGEIEARLVPLGLGASMQSSGGAGADGIPAPVDAVREARTLKILLAINALMFVAELTVAWFAESTGLLADSLDMFADAAVYGLALYAVGRSVQTKVRTALVVAGRCAAGVTLPCSRASAPKFTVRVRNRLAGRRLP